VHPLMAANIVELNSTNSDLHVIIQAQRFIPEMLGQDRTFWIGEEAVAANPLLHFMNVRGLN
jgi:hypothetical protein